MQLTAYKDKGDLHFKREINGGTVHYWFNLGDKCFYRRLKTGRIKEVPDTSLASFFRGIEPHEVSRSFEAEEDAIYRRLIRSVVDHEKSQNRRVTNFATIFSNVADYIHLESYMLLGIRFRNEGWQSPKTVFTEPVNQFSKPVIRFMRECGHEFANNKWESSYRKYPKLISDLCQYVLVNHRDDTEVYKMLLGIVCSEHYNASFDKFVALVTPINDTVRVRHSEEAGFGLEYKAVFDYIIRCVIVEAMHARDAVKEYHDYLEMSRKIERLKAVYLLRERDPDADVRNVDIQRSFKRVEKYPKYLSVRHRVAIRNHEAMKTEYDDAAFIANVNFDYEWSKGDYCVIMPQVSQDVKNEGTNQSHCVGSYVDKIMDGKTQIGFMRLKDSPDDSVLTLEFRAGQITQVRGYGNRDPEEIELEWLKKYAKAKNLSFYDVKRDETLPTPIPNEVKEAA